MSFPRVVVLCIAASLLGACPTSDTAPDASDAMNADASSPDAGPHDAGGCAGETNAEVDGDGDGFTPATGDCDECDPERNPGAIEWPGDDVDDDCDGETDEASTPCDSALSVGDRDATAAARALGLCVNAMPERWGLVDARWLLPDGNVPAAEIEDVFHLGHGLLERFGRLDPREGDRLLLLSTGAARNVDDPAYTTMLDKRYTTGWAPGLPREHPSCGGVITGQARDGLALRLTLRAPTNAHGLSFDHRVFTHDWPNYICSSFNDVFAVHVSPSPEGVADGTITLDAAGGTIGAMSSFIEHCSCPESPAPCPTVTGPVACAAGTAELAGTPFAAGTIAPRSGATRWLRTSAPVTPGETFTLTFLVSDAADGVLDLAVMLDAFMFTSSAPERPITVPLATTPASCGNEVVDDGEACDGSASAIGCETFGYRRGTASCASGCGVDVAACVPKELCRTFSDTNNDQLAGCDDPDCATHEVCADDCAAAVTLVGTEGDFRLRGSPDSFDASCTTGDRYDAAITFEAPLSGRLRVRVSGISDAYSVSVRRGACDLTSTELACVSGIAHGATVIDLDVSAGERLTALVEAGAFSESGRLELIEAPAP